MKKPAIVAFGQIAEYGRILYSEWMNARVHRIGRRVRMYTHKRVRRNEDRQGGTWPESVTVSDFNFVFFSFPSLLSPSMYYQVSFFTSTWPVGVVAARAQPTTTKNKIKKERETLIITKWNTAHRHRNITHFSAATFLEQHPHMLLPLKTHLALIYKFFCFFLKFF